jgi:hypothetical protein
MYGGDDVNNSGESNYSYIGGEVNGQHWEGSPDAVYAEYQLQKAVNGIAPVWDTLRYRWSRGTATLDAEGVADGAVFYELLPNEYRDPTYNHPVFMPGGEFAMTVTEGVQVRMSIEQGWVDNATPPMPFFMKRDATSGILVPASVTALTKNQYKLWLYMVSGVTEIPMTKWVLRSTQNCSLRSSEQINMSDVNTVQDPPDVSTVNTLIGALPTNLEWLYKGGSVQGYQLGRMQIVREWWSEMNPPGWPKFLGGSFDPVC